MTTDKLKINALNRAIEVLQNNKWIRNVIALDNNGNECNPRNKNARQFCGSGAISAATKTIDLFESVKEEVKMTLNGISLADYNDFGAKGKRDVIRLFKKTIKNIEENAAK
jgi:hypothetical protein